MERQRVVVTGLGSVCAAGLGHQRLWSALKRAQPLFSPICRFSPRATEPALAGQVHDFRAERFMPYTLVRQTDISTHYGLASARMALDDAGLNLDNVDRLRCSVMVGHALAGMDYAEPELYNQHVLGPAEVGPYQAIAWFYAATMGQLSIQLGLRGYSKTFVADRASGMHAIGHGFRTLQSGRADLCLAGGVEAPLSPFLYRIIASTGQLSRGGYLPFSAGASGFLLGEGSCFVVLETLAHARRRGAKAYAEITGYGMTTDPQASNSLAGPRELGRAQRLALDAAGSGAVDHVITDGVAQSAGDGSELEALSVILKDAPDCRLSAPKAVVGELYGAGAPLQLIAGALAIEHRTCLAMTGSDDALLPIPHTGTALGQEIERVLIDSRGCGGVSAALVLDRVAENDR